MRHDITVLMAGTPEGSPVPQNHFWQTIGFNDYYLTGYNDYKYPLGSVQVIGNYHEWMYNLVPEALGDLLHRKLAPALYRLHAKGRLNGDVRILGVARRSWSDEEFRAGESWRDAYRSTD